MVRELLERLERRAQGSTSRQEKAFQNTGRAIQLLRVGEYDKAIQLAMQAAQLCFALETPPGLARKLNIPPPGQDPTSPPIEPSPERLARLRKLNARQGKPQTEEYLRQQLAAGLRPGGYSAAEREARLEWQAADALFRFVEAIEMGNKRVVTYTAETYAQYWAQLAQARSWLLQAQALPEPAYHISDLAQRLGLIPTVGSDFHGLHPDELLPASVPIPDHAARRLIDTLKGLTT